MNLAHVLDWVVDAFDIGSVALVVCGAWLALGCKLLGTYGQSADSERIEERNHSKEVT